MNRFLIVSCFVALVVAIIHSTEAVPTDSSALLNDASGEAQDLVQGGLGSLGLGSLLGGSKQCPNDQNNNGNPQQGNQGNNNEYPNQPGNQGNNNEYPNQPGNQGQNNNQGTC